MEDSSTSFAAAKLEQYSNIPQSAALCTSGGTGTSSSDFFMLLFKKTIHLNKKRNMEYTSRFVCHKHSQLSSYKCFQEKNYLTGEKRSVTNIFRVSR